MRFVIAARPLTPGRTDFWTNRIFFDLSTSFLRACYSIQIHVI